MHRILLGLGFLMALAVALCHAEPADRRLSPGDKVEIEWLGKPVEAEFVEYSVTGWIKVKFLHNGTELAPTLPPDQVRILGGGKGAPANQRPLRTWTDTTGKFKQKARFVSLDGDELTLETDAGKTITMPLEKLSEADQAMARKIAAKLAPAAGADGGNPFAGGAPSTRPRNRPEAGRTEPTEAEVAAIDVATGNWSSSRAVVADLSAPWAVTPDGAPLPEKLASKPIALPGTSSGANNFFDKIKALLVGRASARACVVTGDTFKGSHNLLSVVDLVSGRIDAPIRLPARVHFVDVDRSGEFLLTLPDDKVVPGVQGNPAPPVGVWRITADTVEPVRGWDPQNPTNIHKGAPSFAEFIDADHVVCVAFPNMLSVWNVPEAKALWSTEIATGSTPVVSPGGKYLAVAVGERICILDALTGNTAGCLASVPGAGGRLSFRPDGAQLAALSSQRLVVWDLGSGAVYRDIAFSTSVGSGSVDWLYGGYVLCGGSSLVDLERRVVIWKYLGDATGAALGGWGEFGGQFWYALQTDGAQQRALYPVALPHDSVRRVSAGLDPEQLLAVRPGATFTIDVRVQGNAAEQQQVQKALADRLAAAGMTVGNGAPLVLQASTETGKNREMSYRAFGRGRGEAEKVTVTEQISRLKILEQGRLIWEGVVVGGAPMFLEIKQGQTLEQALAPYRQPNLAFFGQVDLPQYVARPAEAGAYGFSRFTPQGVVDTQPPAKPAGN